MGMVADEAFAVARAAGANILLKDDPVGTCVSALRSAAENQASMLQDVLKQRITEVAFINGAIVREGKALGIPTPVNLTLTCLVQAIQETYDLSVGSK